MSDKRNKEDVPAGTFGTMKKQKDERITYDREVVGKRLKLRRKQLGWTRGYVAANIGIVEKYYADIERGTCGMSIETMLALAKLYHFSLDEFIYGPETKTVDERSLVEQLSGLSPQAKERCAQLVYLFIQEVTEKA